MGNTLTEILPRAYSAAVKVADEAAGGLDAVNLNFDNKGMAVGDTLRIPVAPVATTAAFTAAATSTAGTDKIAAATSVTIDASQKTAWHLTGEQIRSLENSQTKQDWVNQLLEQGMRALRNEMEIALMDVIYQGASRAIGVAGTTPFAGSLDIIAEARKELIDNGAPMSDLQLVINSAAGFNIRKLNIFQAADAAGADEERRSGRFGRQFGFAIRESDGIALHTNGTGAGYLIDDAGDWDVGDTTLHVDTGAGTFVLGDVITHATDANDKYVVTTAFAGDGDGDITTAKPGIIIQGDDSDAVTIGDDYTPNVAFERNAVVGVVRPPLIPESAVIQQLPITDNHGMTYLLLDIAQYGQRTWELHIAYGFKVVQGEYIINVMG